MPPGHVTAGETNGRTPSNGSLDGLKRFSSVEKGKGKANGEDVSIPPEATISAGDKLSVNLAYHTDSDEEGAADIDKNEGTQSPVIEGGRGKRVKKKRRLSASDEVDPTTLRSNGHSAKKSRPSVTGQNRAIIPRPPSKNIKRMQAQIKEDEAYASRVAINAAKPQLRNYDSDVPLRSQTRRALYATAEYFSRPGKTAGASIEIGAAGLARGVLLEGVAPGTGNWWQLSQNSGTIIAHMYVTIKDSEDFGLIPSQR